MVLIVAPHSISRMLAPPRAQSPPRAAGGGGHCTSSKPLHPPSPVSLLSPARVPQASCRAWGLFHAVLMRQTLCFYQDRRDSLKVRCLEGGLCTGGPCGRLGKGELQTLRWFLLFPVLQSSVVALPLNLAGAVCTPDTEYTKKTNCFRLQ